MDHLPLQFHPLQVRFSSAQAARSSPFFPARSLWAFSQALQQSHSSSSSVLARNMTSGTTLLDSTASNSLLSSSVGLTRGKTVVLSFISTYCMLAILFSLHHLCLAPLVPPTECRMPSYLALPWPLVPGATLSLNRLFMVGLGYSLIPEKLVTKIRLGQFVDLADLLAENLKAQETVPILL